MKPLPFECVACERRYYPARFPDSCQCDHGRCECGGELEQVDPRETVRWFAYWLTVGCVFWVSVAMIGLAVTQ